MDALGFLVYFIGNAALCITFWNLIEKISKNGTASQTISYISLSSSFVFLTFLSVFVVNWIFGSSSGGFNNMGLVVLSVFGSIFLSLLMVIVGVVRLIGLSKRKTT